MGPYLGIYKNEACIVTGEETTRAGYKYYYIITNGDGTKVPIDKVSKFDVTDFARLESILATQTWIEQDLRTKNQVPIFDEDDIVQKVVNKFNKAYHSLRNYPKFAIKYINPLNNSKSCVYFKFSKKYSSNIFFLNITGKYPLSTRGLAQKIANNIHFTEIRT